MEKKVGRMNVEEVAAMLPITPNPQMVGDLLIDCFDEGFGGHFLLFHRESVTITPEMKRTMSELDWEEYDKKTVHRWGAFCRCTACYGNFEAGYVTANHSKRGIRLFMGEDGQTYDGYADEVDAWNTVEYMEDETMECPLCGCTVMVLSKKSLGNGRNYWIRAASLENVGKYTAIMYWTAIRSVDRSGAYEPVITPWRAAVIDEDGRVKKFDYKTEYVGRVCRQRWQPMSGGTDPFQSGNDRCYLSQKHIDWWVWPAVPDLTGKTGEKTGIDEYVREEGLFPWVYIKTWRQHPQIENIVKDGWAKTVVEGIALEVNNRLINGGKMDVANLNWIDWNEVKPNRMLRINKTDYRRLLDRSWSVDAFKEWLNFRNICSAEEYYFFLQEFGIGNMQEIRVRIQAGMPGCEFYKMMRYIDKQDALLPCDALEQLFDSRTMAMQISGRTELTEEELWPRDLEATHERQIGMLNVKSDPAARMRFLSGFNRVLLKYRELEWNDGSLCIRLPRNNEELVSEGDVLRHCVGVYGENHILEKDVIFFVRKYRRPERSYYTLDIGFQGKPYQKQLHGYGNEHHGENKEYRHSIPKKILDFVERWKNEVLFPWYEEQQKKEMFKEKKGRGKSKQHGAGATAA